MAVKRAPSTHDLDLVERLCAVSPSLTAARLTHIRVLGMLVPHVFMAGVLERVRACLEARTRRERRELQPEVEAILAVLESAMGSAGPGTRHVIASSFVGDAEGRSFFADLHPLMGRRLAELVREK